MTSSIWTHRGDMQEHAKHIGGETFAIEDQYPTMSLEELKQLDVKSLANKDCIIYMWVTNPKLDWGIELA